MTDHAARWPWWKIVIRVALALLITAWQGPIFVRNLRPPPPPNTIILDFLQEWASARFYFDDLPIYTRQEVALKRYFGAERDLRRPFNKVNAHPPTAVLFALPFGHLSYPNACLAWNLLSIGMIGGSLAIVKYQLRLKLSAWTLFPAVVLAFLCSPLRLQLFYVQLNALLLLLLTWTWVAARSGHDWQAGVVLGTAVAIKLFPGFLFGFFLIRWRWKAILGGLGAILLWSVVTLLVFDLEAYQVYFFQVIPELQEYRDRWSNISLSGLWFKLFAGTGKGGHSIPLFYSPGAAFAGILICTGSIVALIVWSLLRVRSSIQLDHAYGMIIIGMLLVSPITWPHYLLLLLVPVALLWKDERPSKLTRILLAVTLLILWLNPELFYVLVYRADARNWYLIRAQPWQTLTVNALHTYALLVLFALALHAVHANNSVTENTNEANLSSSEENETCEMVKAE